MSSAKRDVWCESCGCVMKLRDGKFGKFYGCTGYPVCRNTKNLRDAALEDDPPDMSDYVRWDR